MKKIPTFNRRLRIKSGQFGMVRWGNKDEWTMDYKPLFTEWYNCRNSFHFHWDKSYRKEFYYAHDYKAVESVVKEVETKLNLSLRSSVKPTDWNNVAWIKPSRFWRNQPIRMSLFSILMRVASNYHGNLDEAIDCDPYAETTKSAIKFFLEGNCRYAGKETGWYHQFDKRMLEYNKLTLPELLKPSGFWREIKLTFFG